jgi:hypothetical protein
MLKAKNLPRYFWGEAVTTAVHILNRAPTRVLDGKIPFEAWHGERPHVHYFRIFGCIGHVKNTRPGLKKPEDRNSPMIFIGYESRSKAYRFYDPTPSVSSSPGTLSSTRPVSGSGRTMALRPRTRGPSPSSTRRSTSRRRQQQNTGVQLRAPRLQLTLLQRLNTTL